MDSMRILICDDSRLARNQMKQYILSKYDFEILEAADGQMAIDIYKEASPDLVFMDIVMPVVSGIQALSEIMTFDSKARVVMASSVGTQKFLKEAITLGAIDFLQKPFTEEMVQKALQHLSESRV